MGKSLRRFPRARLCTSRGATEENSPRREPWVKRTNESSPGWGERDLHRVVFCRPYRGLNGFGYDTHGFTVGYYLPRLRRWGNHLPMLVRKSFSSRAKARSTASWFFQFEKSGMWYLRTASD
jgi:hypothetical protein